MVHKLSPIDHGALSVSSRDRVRPRRMSVQDCGVASSARFLQHVVVDSDVSRPGRWSPRRSFAFMVAVNGASWLGIAAVMKAVL